MVAGLLGLFAAVTTTTNVFAESLADAMALAYQSNPTLQAQRAQQRSLDETYVQARAGWRPVVGVAGQAYWSRTDLGSNAGGAQLVANGAGGFAQISSGHYVTNYGSGALTATQPLYTGGRVGAAVQAAEAVVLAGREALRVTESQVLQGVVTAYEDVRRDQQILVIRQDNAAVLQGQLEETQAKFDVGQVTRTDVAQAQAQLASAKALLSTSKAQLQISRASYAAAVGQNPGDLAPEPPLPGLPDAVEQAFEAAEVASPTLREAQITEQVSRARIAEARAAYRPTVSAQASIGYTGALSPFGVHNFDRAVSGELTVNQPLFTGGIDASRTRQALEQNTSDRISIEGARRSVVLVVAQAWNTMIGDRASVISNQEQVRAAEVASEGIREQYRAGLSTTLDVLIQQQTLEAAQLSLVQAHHDEYVAEGALLSAMGRLEARDLVRGVSLYDAANSFKRVSRRGSTPWEALVEAIDSVGVATVPEPTESPAPLQLSTPPTMVSASPGGVTRGSLSTVQPTKPLAPTPQTTIGPR